MDSEWSTREQDIDIAESIISKHIDDNDGSPLTISAVYFKDEGELNICYTDWITELAWAYHKEHGQKKGLEVTNRVLTKCLAGYETFH